MTSYHNDVIGEHVNGVDGDTEMTVGGSGEDEDSFSDSSEEDVFEKNARAMVSIIFNPLFNRPIQQNIT